MTTDTKLFLGHRLRRLRRERELSQTGMAASLTISPSYLNHLERNQRPVTAGLLLKLANLYGVDILAFASPGGHKTGPDELSEIFADGRLKDLGVPRYELVELAHNAPSVAEAIARLYAAMQETDRLPALEGADDARALTTPENWVRDYIQQHRNHYPELEEAAMVDGCSRFGALWRIIVPLSAPGVATAAILAFVNSWNEFLLALTFARSPNVKTIPPAIVDFQSQFGGFQWEVVSAAIIVAIIPVVVIILVFQQKIISGLTSGSVKG